MLKKNNIFIKRIIQNYKKNPNKKIVSDSKKSLTYSQLINLALFNSKKIREINSDFIPIIVERNVDTVVAILSVIFSKKIFCPISNKYPNERVNLLLKILKCNFLINCSNNNFVDKDEIKIDFKINDSRKIPIEIRGANELSHLTFKKKKKISTGEIYLRDSNKFNPAFDVTPAKYITKLITENGLVEPTKSEIMKNLLK